MELLNLTQTKILKNGFLACRDSLYDNTNAFVGAKKVSLQKSSRNQTMTTLNTLFNTQETTMDKSLTNITEATNEETDTDKRRSDNYVKQLTFQL